MTLANHCLLNFIINIKGDVRLSELNTIGVSFSSSAVKIVEKLEEEMKLLGIRVHRYDNEIRVKDDIINYMNFLINLNVIILIIDENYFKSPFCLYELANLINFPNKLLIVYKGEKIENLIIKINKSKLLHQNLQNNSAMNWVKKELLKYNFDIIFSKISNLFREKYLTPQGLFDNQGKKYILQMLRFTPTLHWEKLNEILKRNTFMEREEGFEDYLKYGVANDVFFYQKALSYEKEKFWSGVGYYLQKSIDYNPASIAAYVKLCELIIADKLEVDYIEKNTKKWELISENSMENRIKAYHYHAKGLYYFKQGKDKNNKEILQIADKNFNISLKYEKENATLYNNKGQIYEIMGNITQAALYYERAITLKPDYYQAYNNLGLLFLKYLQDEKTAIAYYQKALSIKEDYDYAMNGMAIATEKINIKEAMKTYLEIVCKNVKSTEPLTNMALILEEDMEDIELAGMFYESIYKTNTKSISAAFNYANYLRRYKKDLVKSEKLLTYVYNFMPQSDIVIMTFALLYFQRGDYISCKEKINDLLVLFPDYDSAIFLGNIINYFIDNNKNEIVLEQMKKISGCFSMKEMVQYIEKTYLKQSKDRIYKNRIAKFFIDDKDFLILEQIKSNLQSVMGDMSIGENS